MLNLQLPITEAPPMPHPRATSQSAESKHTLRDDLAGLAMQGLLAGHFAHYGHENDWNCGDLAKFSYNIADAMLIARELEKSSE